MEPVHVTNKASKSASEEDVLSRMPDNVITNILNRLPLQTAVGTSILSRKWRFKWTTLTQLKFDVDFLRYQIKGRDYDFSDIVSRLLLHLIGPITKFFLFLVVKEFDIEHINHWVMCLSRKGIRELTLISCQKTPLKLSSHLFSCLELKHLELRKCIFHHPPDFHGFPNLSTLVLDEVTEINNLVEFITKCPSLEILEVGAYRPIGKVKLVGIAILENLTVLSLPFCMLDDVAITGSAVFKFDCYLPKLQELCLNFNNYTFLGEAGVRKWVFKAFPCLKSLTLYPIDFRSASMLSFALEMILGSQNLQTLKITNVLFDEARYNGNVPPPAFCFPEVDNNIKLQQLQSVVFKYFTGSENEVYLIKILLACSPLLQCITIHVKPLLVFGDDHRRVIFAEKLLELDRASPTAKVKIC